MVFVHINHCAGLCATDDLHNLIAPKYFYILASQHYKRGDWIQIQ
jgi:hypothetical protein